MKITLYFLWHRKGGYAAEGPFIDSEAAEDARTAHAFSADRYDIVTVELPCAVWEFS